jgi:hypothetical protein
MMQLAAASGEIVVKGAPILLAVEACGKGVMRLRFGGSAAVAAAPSYLPKAGWAGATAVAEARSTDVVAGGGLSLRQRVPHSTMTTARPMLIAPAGLRGRLSRSNNFPADWPYASLPLKAIRM